MNKNTPDFSATLELVDHQLAGTEKRLRKKRERDSKAQEGSTEPKGSQSSDKNEVQPETNDEVPKKRKVTAQAKLIPGLKEKERRRNLSLKVTEANEIRFHQLFHKMQLAGDNRKKQDLADEALELLFAQYGRVYK